MPVRVPLPFAKPTMRLAAPINDAAGKLIAGAVTALGPHVVGMLRKMAIQYDRRPLADLACAAARAITDVVRVSTGEPEGDPGLMLALQAFGQDLTLTPPAEYLALPTP